MTAVMLNRWTGQSAPFDSRDMTTLPIVPRYRRLLTDTFLIFVLEPSGPVTVSLAV